MPEKSCFWMSPTMPWPRRFTSAACAAMASERTTATMMMNSGMRISTLSDGMVTRPQTFTGPSWRVNSRSIAGSRNFSSRAVRPPEIAAQNMEAKKAGLCRDR
ncbi:hypothetical protein D3C80_1968610 [compost metagenome]